MGSSFYIAKRERGLVKLGELEKLDASDISDKSDGVGQSQTGRTWSDGSERAIFLGRYVPSVGGQKERLRTEIRSLNCKL